jgi:hypothetical protein
MMTDPKSELRPLLPTNKERMSEATLPESECREPPMLHGSVECPLAT